MDLFPFLSSLQAGEELGTGWSSEKEGLLHLAAFPLEWDGRNATRRPTAIPIESPPDLWGARALHIHMRARLGDHRDVYKDCDVIWHDDLLSY